MKDLKGENASESDPRDFPSKELGDCITALSPSITALSPKKFPKNNNLLFSKNSL